MRQPNSGQVDSKRRRGAKALTLAGLTLMGIAALARTYAGHALPSPTDTAAFALSLCAGTFLGPASLAAGILTTLRGVGELLKG